MSREDELIRDALKLDVTPSDEINNRILRTATRKKARGGFMRVALTVALCFIVFFGTVTAVDAAIGGKLAEFIKEKISRRTKEPADVTVITYAIPNYCDIDEEKLALFNEALVKDGHKYRLEIKSLDSVDYQERLEPELDNGTVDVAFLGLGDWDGGNGLYNLLKSGRFMNLDEILTTEKGKAIYEAFPKKQWEAAKCDGQTLSIPQGRWITQNVYVAFNRDYVSDAEINNWDGSIDGLYEIIRKVKWNDSSAPCLQYVLDADTFTEIFDCSLRYGLLFDMETLSIENPLESEKFTGYLKTLNQMLREGYMKKDAVTLISTDVNQALYDMNVTNNLKAGRFAAAISYGTVEDVFLKDNIVVKEFKTYLQPSVNATVAISQKTQNLDAVVDFLSLLYTDGRYANILLYGQEGIDYHLVNGVVCNMDGSDLDWGDSFFTKVAMNVFINVHPVNGEVFAHNRKEEMFAYFDSVELSPFIGFEPDTTGINNLSDDVQKYWIETIMSETDSFEEITANAKEKLKADGMDSYLDSIKKQWEEFRKKQ